MTTLLRFPTHRKPRAHAREDGIFNVRTAQLIGFVASQESLESELADHLEGELEKLFPNRADQERLRETW
jgi:hypothetical protein